MDAYAGIDLAFAKKKRLPVVVCAYRNGRLEPFPLRGAAAKPPYGLGNVRALERDVVVGFANETAAYLRTIESEFGIRIRRIAIDAPSRPRPADAKRRLCEIELDQRRISCITTPSADDFEVIRRRAAKHLNAQGSESRLPGANQLWMLVGFELFRRLGVEWECIEVFPQAIATALNAQHIHKSHRDGVAKQLAAVARRTNWPKEAGVASLTGIGYGSIHDRLDAYMASWIAALDDCDRLAIGRPPDDVIWVPRLESIMS